MNAPLREVYAMAASGLPEAESWLLAFHQWAHDCDDFVDCIERERGEAVDLMARLVPLMTCSFAQRHASVLGPVVAIVAAQYRSSLELSGVMCDVTRLAGNQVVLLVAYLTGGPCNVRRVSRALWPIVQETQIHAV